VSALPTSLEKHPLLDTWVRIDPAETVTVFSGKSEHGQGLRSMLARIGAEELDVALERVRVATADTAHGLDEGLTAGSTSTQESGAALRQAAAEARAHLLGLAAAELGVDVCELRVEDGTIAARDRTTSYWQLLGGKRFGVRATGRVATKPPSEHRIVGREARRIDLVPIVTGTARYLQDLSTPGMLHGRVVRPPSRAARLEAVDEERARALPGVVAVVRDGGFLGVVAEREEQALAAAAALSAAARWSEKPTLPPQGSLARWLREQRGEAFLVVEGVAVEGDVPPLAEPPGASRTVRATYTRPFTLHGSIGPSAAVAQWSDGRLEVWSSTQGVFPLRKALAEALRVEQESVRVRHVEAAGCYGHNGADDVALDAALLARAAGGRPVRVVLTREQEHTWEPYGPAAVIDLQASLDADGRLLGWNHDVWSNGHVGRAVVAPPGTSALAAAWQLAEPVPPSVPKPRLQYHAGIHRNADPLYAVPNRRIVKHFVEAAPVRVSSLRSLGAFANVFAIESFLDELAEAAGSDPVAFRLSYLEDERARAVLERAAAEVGAQGRGEFGRGVGIAFAQYKNLQCYAAVAVELHVDDATAAVVLDRVVVAADAGAVIDPKGLANQLEGGVVQAASWTLQEQVTFDDTRITSSSWDSYPILTFPEVPEVEVLLLDRPGVTSVGAGEATQGPTAAAIANAVHDAIGVRLRDLPLTPERIRAAAASL
jgi:CO/xanthine dehydrogenase Mo-binding subunit